MPSIVAIIPARGGSKRLPRKNMAMLAGKPLVYYSIMAAKLCPLITEVVVSSDDTEILNFAQQMEVKSIIRPAELATDLISNEHVVRHVLEQAGMQYEYVTLLQPTSPLRNAIHLEECLANFLASNMRCTMSVCLASHHPGKYMTIEHDTLQPYTSIADVEARMQTLNPVYRQNGAIYALRTEDFLASLKFYQPPCLPYIMPIEASVDIDSQFDLKFCEFLVNNYGNPPRHPECSEGSPNCNTNYHA